MNMGLKEEERYGEREMKKIASVEVWKRSRTRHSREKEREKNRTRRERGVSDRESKREREKGEVDRIRKREKD